MFAVDGLSDSAPSALPWHEGVAHGFASSTLFSALSYTPSIRCNRFRQLPSSVRTDSSAICSLVCDFFRTRCNRRDAISILPPFSGAQLSSCRASIQYYFCAGIYGHLILERGRQAIMALRISLICSHHLHVIRRCIHVAGTKLQHHALSMARYLLQCDQSKMLQNTHPELARVCSLCACCYFPLKNSGSEVERPERGPCAALPGPAAENQARWESE